MGTRLPCDSSSCMQEGSTASVELLGLGLAGLA
jgi:hypothetical protein